MSSAGEVILVLKIAMNIAPVALYFIILGLVNSQGCVHVVSAKRDWLGLMVVFFPVLFWPVMWLAGMGWAWAAVLLLLAGITMVVISAPDKCSGWVIYNCELDRVVRHLLISLRNLSLDYTLVGGGEIVVSDGMTLQISGLQLLKNVTISVKGGSRRTAGRLGYQLQQRLMALESRPSMSAAAMLVSGTVLLIVPLTMMIGRMDAFVKVVSQFIPV